MKNEIKIFCADSFKDYELLDTGEGEKLERFGPYIFVRPLEDAVWKKTLPRKEWENVDGKFWSAKTGAKAGWKMSNLSKAAFDKWEMEYRGIKFWASPTSFRHLGFFPEQAAHWDFIEERIKSAEARLPQKVKFLNLFGYTGVASLFALRAGAEVTHVDASKQVLKWAKENQTLSGMEKLPMRIMEDDAIKFLEREIKRGSKYDAIIMDPPKFGRGPKGEVWKIEEMLRKLILLSRKVLSDKPLFVILTSYATDSSSLSLGYSLEESLRGLSGKMEVGELCVREKSKGRLVSLAHTATWQAN